MTQFDMMRMRDIMRGKGSSPTPFQYMSMPLPKDLPQSINGAAPLKVGMAVVRVLAHRYRVERKMGSGAFGTVFLVTDLQSRNERYDSTTSVVSLVVSLAGPWGLG